MSENNQVIRSRSPYKSKIIIVGFLIGLFFTMIAWIIDIILNKIHISFAGILQIHKENPVIFMIDLIPIITVITIYIVNRRREEEKQIFDVRIKERDARLDKMAEFAKQIGEGNYKAQLDLATDNDTLVNSLLLMRDNLLSNYKKESEQSWIAEGKAIISDILRLNNKIEELSGQVVHDLVKYINVIQNWAACQRNADSDLFASKINQNQTEPSFPVCQVPTAPSKAPDFLDKL